MTCTLDRDPRTACVPSMAASPPRWDARMRRRMRQLHAFGCALEAELERLAAPAQVHAELRGALDRWRAQVIAEALSLSGPAAGR